MDLYALMLERNKMDEALHAFAKEIIPRYFNSRMRSHIPNYYINEFELDERDFRISFTETSYGTEDHGISIPVEYLKAGMAENYLNALVAIRCYAQTDQRLAAEEREVKRKKLLDNTDIDLSLTPAEYSVLYHYRHHKAKIDKQV